MDSKNSPSTPTQDSKMNKTFICSKIITLFNNIFDKRYPDVFANLNIPKDILCKCSVLISYRFHRNEDLKTKTLFIGYVGEKDKIDSLNLDMKLDDLVELQNLDLCKEVGGDFILKYLVVTENDSGKLVDLIPVSLVQALQK